MILQAATVAPKIPKAPVLCQPMSSFAISANREDTSIPAAMPVNKSLPGTPPALSAVANTAGITLAPMWILPAKSNVSSKSNA